MKHIFPHRHKSRLSAIGRTTPAILFTDGLLQGVFIGHAGVLYSDMVTANFRTVLQKPTTGHEWGRDWV